MRDGQEIFRKSPVGHCQIVNISIEIFEFWCLYFVKVFCDPVLVNKSV